MKDKTKIKSLRPQEDSRLDVGDYLEETRGRYLYTGPSYLKVDRRKNFLLFLGRKDLARGRKLMAEIPLRDISTVPVYHTIIKPVITNLGPLVDLVSELRVRIAPGVVEIMEELATEAKELSSLSVSTSENLVISGLGGTQYPFQSVGVLYINKARRVIVADEMGVGKTITALASAAFENGFPLLIVCPSSATLNWAKEASIWLPSCSVGVVAGTKAKPARPIVMTTRKGKHNISVNTFDTNVLICSYSVVEKNLKKLKAFGHAMFVADEAHYLKNPDAKRTKACMELAVGANPVALLTGTPIKNNTVDLLPQLIMVGMIGKDKPLGSEWSFKQRYCNPMDTNFGTTYTGGQNSRELNTILKANCMIRRKKSQVLKELPPITRSIVPFELERKHHIRMTKAQQDPAGFIYDLAMEEPDIAKMVKKYMGITPDEISTNLRREYAGIRYGKAMYAIDLIRMLVERRVVGEAKIGPAIEWITDFLSEDQKLVVFAVHRFVQSAMSDAFPDAEHVFGEDSQKKRFDSVERFQQDDNCRLIICSLFAAAEAITLTAASNVLFLEFGWTPSDHAQAEARIHRIGQNENRVTAWYLCALNTIDEHMASVVEDKLRLASNVIDGNDPIEPFVATLIDRLKP